MTSNHRPFPMQDDTLETLKRKAYLTRPNGAASVGTSTAGRIMARGEPKGGVGKTTRRSIWQRRWRRRQPGDVVDLDPRAMRPLA